LRHRGEPEVENLHHSRGRDHDVGRLQVAMNDVLFVGRFKSIGDLAGVVQGGLERKWPSKRLTIH